MKGFLILLLAFILCFSIVACGNDDSQVDNSEPIRDMTTTSSIKPTNLSFNDYAEPYKTVRLTLSSA